MDRRWRFNSRTSATTCLRLSPVAHRSLKPSSCRVSAICASMRIPAMRRAADIEAWSAGIARLSRSWAQPLLSALDSGAVVRIMIRDERGNRFTATRRGRFRLWRRDGLAARIAAQSGRVR